MRIAGALGALIVLGATGPAALASPAAVPSLLRVSGPTPFAEDCGGPGNPSRASEVETHLAVDPADSRRLLAAWQQDRHTVFGGARGNAGARSADGGRTATSTSFPGVTTCSGGPRDRASDPWVSFGADGTAYALHLTFDYLEPFATADLAGPTQVVVQTSADGGRTFGAPVDVVDEGFYDDRPALTADPYRPGRAYAIWTRRLGAFGESGTTEISRTDDGGLTWSPNRTIHVPGPGRLTIPSLINVLPDGSLVATMVVIEARYALSDAPVEFEILAMRSADEGETWSDAVRIGSTPSTQPEDPDGGGLRALPVISTDVAPDGTVHTVWNSIDSARASRIMLASSGDGGRTWTSPVAVAEPPGQAFLPAAAVGRDGTVGVLWDDTRRDRPGDRRLTTDVWFSHSHDGGRTWIETRVAGPFDALEAPPTSSTAVGGRFLGDYQALVAQPRGFAALFPQSRPVAAEGATDAFLARIRTDGRDPRLRLAVRPRRVRARSTARFRFRVMRRAGGRATVRGATVRFAGRRVRTGRRGRATLVVRLRRTGRHRAVASKPGFQPGRAIVRVLPRR